MGFSIGGISLGSSRSTASTRSSSASQSSSGSRSSQDVFLADLYSRLFGGASEAAGGINTAGLTGAANDLFNAGAGFIEGLGANAEPLAGPSFLASPVTARGVAPVGVPGSTVEAEISQLETDLGRFFSEDLNPAITSEAVGGGGLGGSRQGVAQGKAAEAVLGEFARGTTDIRSRDIDRRISVAEGNRDAALASSALQLEADQFSSNLALEADRLGGQFSLAAREQESGAAGSALSFLPSLLELASTGTYAELSPYLMLAQVLSDPTVLTQAESESQSTSSSASSGQSSSRSWNFGLGG